MRGAALALLAALAAGCAVSKVPKVGEPGPRLADDAAEAAYQKVLETYTSHREIYNGFDTRIFAAMTYQSPAFIEARVRRRGAFLRQPPAVVDANVQQQLSEAEPFYEFFFGVHLNNVRYDDFGRTNSTWRVALLTPSGDVLPLKLERVGRSNLNLRALYPYLDDFWTAYSVRFAKELDGVPTQPPGTTKLVVRMASTLGQTDFEFPAQ